jgi:sulfofructosephosphate aldolase
MTQLPSTDPRLLAPLMQDGGGFAMVALDQRESLRRMFPVVDGAEASDEQLRSFKRDAMSVLSPLASATLLDRLYAVDVRRPPELSPGSALILAADVLVQPAGEPVVDTLLDPLVTADFAMQVGAAALKLLVIWSRDGSTAQRQDLVESFLDVTAEAQVASLVEGIVRPAGRSEWIDGADRHEAILEAAAELSSYGGSIYKAEVPGYLPGDVSRVREHAIRMTEVVQGPWVVLSNGVRATDFPEAMGEAVLGGASGFLAGRAIWADTLDDDSPAAALRERSVARLRALSLTVSNAHAS